MLLGIKVIEILEERYRKVIGGSGYLREERNYIVFGKSGNGR